MSYKSKPEDYTLGSQPENKEKNRAPDVLPGKSITYFLSQFGWQCHVVLMRY